MTMHTDVTEKPRIKWTALVQVTLVLGIVTTMILGFVSCLRQFAWQEDFSKQSPTKIYQMVMGHPPAKGVSKIVCSGRHYFIKRWAWMRFQATDHASHEIISSGSPLPRLEAKKLLSEIVSDRMGYVAEDKKIVGWENVDRISDPIAYQFFQGSTGTWLWRGMIIVDRSHHTIYVEALGD